MAVGTPSNRFRKNNFLKHLFQSESLIMRKHESLIFGSALSVMYLSVNIEKRWKLWFGYERFH